MSKELTPLEALNYFLKQQDNLEKYGSSGGFKVAERREKLTIIEKALKKQIIDDYEHPRKKGFKRDNRLRLAYQEMGRYSKNEEVPQELRGKPYGDIVGIVPEEEKARWDIYLLFNMLLHRSIHDSQWDKDKKCFVEYPCLLQELENRGYDVKTIYFEIAKRNKKRKYTSYKNYLRFSENYNFDYKTEQKKLKALEIIKEKQIDMYRLKDAIEFEFEKDEHAVEFYNQDYGEDFCITIEEFRLLKEVLK